MVACLEPLVLGTTVKIYPPPMLDHWADILKAVNDTSLTANNFPHLLDLPATVLNKPVKNKSILMSTMKNILIPVTEKTRISNFTKMDDKPIKLGTTTDLDGPDHTHHAPTNVNYKDIGTAGDYEEEELHVSTNMLHINLDIAQHTKISTASQRNKDLEMPPKQFCQNCLSLPYLFTPLKGSWGATL